VFWGGAAASAEEKAEAAARTKRSRTKLQLVINSLACCATHVTLTHPQNEPTRRPPVPSDRPCTLRSMLTKPRFMNLAFPDCLKCAQPASQPALYEE
jgi:hypothetical protein